MKTRMQEKIEKLVTPKLLEKFGFGNPNMTPRLEKAVLNVGIRADLKDPKFIEEFSKDLASISGQYPVKTRAKKSISAFKIREGQVVGLMVTLRGKRMYEFVDKLFNVALARIRDFRGLEEKGFDKNGNYSIGFRDQISFPEISPDGVSHPFGAQVTLTVKARKPEHSREFLRLLGLPLKKAETLKKS